MLLGLPNKRRGHSVRAHAGLGFRRIAAVRIDTSGASTRFEVDGVVHRYPVRRPVSARMAARLVAAGVPVVMTASPVEDPSC